MNNNKHKGYRLCRVGDIFHTLAIENCSHTLEKISFRISIRSYHCFTVWIAGLFVIGIQGFIDFRIIACEND